MKFLSIIALVGIFFGSCSFSSEAQPLKSACNARNDGKFWPEEANHDSHEARQLLQSGELEMCSLVIWKYKWEKMSVNAHPKSKKREPGAERSGPDRAGAQD